MLPDDVTLLYFIRQVPDGPIKIGYSSDPWARLNQLQTGNPNTLRLLGMCWGSPQLERAVHDHLKEYQMTGEWFLPTLEVLECIRKLIPDHKEWSVKGFKDDGEWHLRVKHNHWWPYLCVLPGRSSGDVAKWVAIEKARRHFKRIESQASAHNLRESVDAWFVPDYQPNYQIRLGPCS